jgi:hypothetical protein
MKEIFEIQLKGDLDNSELISEIPVEYMAYLRHHGFPSPLLDRLKQSKQRQRQM